MSDTATDEDRPATPEPPVKPASKKQPLLDLDALLQKSIEENTTEPKTVVVPLIGRDWTLVEPQNVYVNLSLSTVSDDPFVMIEAAAEYVALDERDDFKKALKRMPKLPVQAIVVIINGFAEALSGRPTGRSKS